MNDFYIKRYDTTALSFTVAKLIICKAVSTF